MNDTGKKEKNWVLKDWTVYPQLNLIQNHQTEFYLKPRLMRLFEYLLLHQNEVVTRDAILEYVWEDRIVTENLLTKSISELRKILEEKFGDELEIETIRNVGYRFNTQFVIATGDGKNTSRKVVPMEAMGELVALSSFKAILRSTLSMTFKIGGKFLQKMVPLGEPTTGMEEMAKT